MKAVDLMMPSQKLHDIVFKFRIHGALGMLKQGRFSEDGELQEG